MAINCELKLEGDILFDCGNKAKAGIEANIVFLNFEDVDKTTSTIDGTNPLLITSLSTFSGTTGYLLEGIKQVNGASSELVKKEDSFDMYKHLFSGVILTPSVENKAFLKQVAEGKRFIIALEKLWKGDAQEDAFEVLGWDSGLEISTIVWNTKESSGVIKFELTNADGYEETDMPRNLLETDYPTTKTAFGNKFATA